jgi:hypothetical protein
VGDSVYGLSGGARDGAVEIGLLHGKFLSGVRVTKE